MRYKIVIALCAIIFIFLLVPAIGEFIFFECSYGCPELVVHAYGLLASLIFSFLFILVISIFFSGWGWWQRDVLYLYHDGSEQRAVLLFVLFAFLLFLTFYFKVGSGYSVKGFAEAYRNGLFSGTGLYTVLGVQVSPFLLAFLLVKSKKITIYFYVSVILVLLMTFLLGLRVYLLIMFLFLVCRMMISLPILKSGLILLGILVCMSSYKIFLNDNLSFNDLYNTSLHVLGRLSIRYVLNSPQYYSYDGLQCLIPLINSFPSVCDLEAVKGMLVNQNMNIMKEMPFINKLTGVAMPLPVFIHNIVGLGGVVIGVFCSVVFISGLFWRVSVSKSVLESLICMYLAFLLFAGLVEDINFYRKFIYLPLLVGVSWMVMKVRVVRWY